MAEQLPLVRSRSVEPSGQSTGFQNVEYSPDAYGAGFGRALKEIGAQGQDLARSLKVAQDERKANDAIAGVQSAKDELRVSMFDPTNGILSKKGAYAQGGGNQAAIVTEDIRKKYLSTIKDPETAEAWSKLWDREAETAKDQAARHELDQMGTYKLDVNKAVVFGAMQDAYDSYNDPKAVEQAIANTREAIAVNSMGQPPGAIAVQQSEAISKVRLAVISRLAAEDPSKAMDYYKQYKDDITGPDHTTATQFIEPALNQQKMDQQAATIMGTGGQRTADLYTAVEFAESSFNPGAISEDGAIGLMQLMPDTARYMARVLGMPEVATLSNEEMTDVLTRNPNLNRQLGQGYLNEQLNKFGGDIEAALVAYNAGPGRAEVFLNHNAGRPPGQRDYNIPGYEFLDKETRPYVEKILGAYTGGKGPAEIRSGRMTPENWTLQNLKPEDILAPTEGGQWVDARAATSLDSVVGDFMAQFPGAKVKINEAPDASGVTAGRRRGTSDPKDNPHVKNSQHIHGTAFDVQIQGMNDVQKAAFLSLARQRGFGGIGFYGPNGHLHIDMGSERKWGNVPAWAKTAMQTPVGKVPGQPVGAPTGSTSQANVGGQGGTAPGTGSYYVGLQPPALTMWMEQANQIADPTVRAGVIDRIKVEAAKQEGAVQQQQAALKQEAWEMVVNGSVKDIPPQMVMQLGDDQMKSLYAFENARASGGVPQDWAAWAEFSAMASTDAIKSEDIYTNWRNKFDDAHFDQALALQRAAVAADKSGDPAAKALTANQRTQQQIVGDTMASLGWKPSKQGEAKKIADFTKVLESRILSEQQVLGRPLNGVEMQDIVDKLILADQAPGLFNVSEGMAFQNIDKEQLNEFVAAPDWESVQPDDREVLVNSFRSYFGEDPDREYATDTYNRAMRVWLGAPPELTDDEETFLRNNLEARTKRQLSEKEFTLASRKWLLTFLGR